MTALDAVVVADNAGGWNVAAWSSDPPDVYLCLGDLSHADLRRLDGAPRVGVFGNHDDPRRRGLDTDMSGGLAASFGTWGGWRYVAVSGCVRYKNEPDILYTQREYAAALDGIDTPLDLVVAHCPPRGCNDHDDPAHVGIDALDRLVRRCRPSLLLHGHTYPDPPRTEFLGAQVVYVYGSRRMRLSDEDGTLRAY